jgi:hypothetical protein
MNKTATTITILLIIIIISLIPYYLIKNEITLTNETFSSIGSYLSGIIGILNLCVFVYLTNLVAKYENTKSANEIRTQKIITQTNFRQSELDRLIIELDKPFDTDGVSNAERSLYRITKASITLTNFLNQKQYLFPIIRDPKNMELGNIINETFEEMIVKLESKNKKEEVDGIENIFLKIQDQKNEFIHLLQAFIINELE